MPRPAFQQCSLGTYPAVPPCTMVAHDPVVLASRLSSTAAVPPCTISNGGGQCLYNSAVLAKRLSSTTANNVRPLEWRRTVHQIIQQCSLVVYPALQQCRRRAQWWTHSNGGGQCIGPIIQQCSLVVYPALQQCRCLAKWRIHSNGGGQLLCP